MTAVFFPEIQFFHLFILQGDISLCSSWIGQMLVPSLPGPFLGRWNAYDGCLHSKLFVSALPVALRALSHFFFVGVLKNGVWDKLLCKGFSISCFSKGAKPGPCRLPILGAPNLPIGSLGVGHIPRHEQSLLGVTPVDSPGDGWSLSQLQPVFLGWCPPGAAPESKPESRAKPAEGGESV